MKAPLSLLLATSFGLSLAAPVFAQTTTQTQTRAKHEADKKDGYEELLIENGGDLPSDHWASNTIEELIKKYCGIMVGYPNNTFRGNSQVNRYELAAALYKLMQCIEEVTITETTDTSMLATREDLQKIAALQTEFKKELDLLNAERVALEKRVDALEQVKVKGSVEFRYRERVAVTDGTVESSPLFAGGNTSPQRRVTPAGVVEQRDAATENTLAFNNNINQYGRDRFGVPNIYNSPAEANVTLDDLVPFRLRTQLNVEAALSPWAKANLLVEMFDLTNASSGLTVTPLTVSNGGHDGNEGTPDGAVFVFRQAFMELQAPDSPARLRAGMMNLKPVLNTGTRFSSLFNQGSWNGRGYGLVGWGGSEVALSNNGNKTYLNSVSRYWNGGIDASMVDPDSMGYNNVSAPGASFDVDWGWGSFVVAGNYGSTQTNRLQAAQGNLSTSLGSSINGTSEAFNTSSLFSGAIVQGLDLTPNAGQTARVANHLALPSQFGDGYGVVGLEGRFFQESFPVRLQLAGMSYFNDTLTDFTNPTRKEVSGTLDIGWNKNFGLTVQANKSFIGYDRHSAAVFLNDIADSGIDIQVGANLATRGLFNLNDMAAGSAGAALGIPLWKASEDSKQNIKVILAARQSLGNRFGNLPSDAVTPNQLFKDSGFTVSIPWENVGGHNVNIYAQYSMLMADALWDLRPVAQDVSLISRLYW
jgi:hypothetical protein